MQVSHCDKIDIHDRNMSSAYDQESKEAAYGLLTDQEILRHIAKTGAKGFARTSIIKQNGQIEYFGRPNLVLLSGREFLAQKLADIPQSADVDQRNYKIRYFGYGQGGAQEGTGTVPNKMGPFDDDTGLYAPGHFHSGSTDDASHFKYIHNGMKKLIRAVDGAFNGTITIEKENHTINKGSIGSGTNTETGTSIIKESFTAIKYTMFIASSEFVKYTSTGTVISSNPYPFNEAALYAVNTKHVMNSDGVTLMEAPAGSNVIEQQNADAICFARFTTSTKYIEEGESVKIEWYILV